MAAFICASALVLALHASLSLSLLPAPPPVAQIAINAAAPGPFKLVKKFQAYNSGLVSMARYRRDAHFFSDSSFAVLRIDVGMGWTAGTPDQTGIFGNLMEGSAAQPIYNLSTVSELTRLLAGHGVLPYYSMCYIPAALQEGGNWRSGPSNLTAWQAMHTVAASSIKAMGLTAVYEMYNEPDGTWFFTGNWDAYLALYAAGAAGVLAANDPHARIVGPAVAFIDPKNLGAFLDYVKQHSLPLDALSIHSYCPLDCVLSRIAQTKQIMAAHGFSSTPIHLNEVNTVNSPDVHNHFQMAVEILGLAEAIAGDEQVTQVNWAQFMDSGAGDNWGTIDVDGRKKASYNAWLLYNAMPVGSVAASSNTSALHVLSSANATCVMAVVWDAANSDHAAEITLTGLPFGAGVAVLYRIDRAHSSFYDNPASEGLQPLQRDAVSSSSYATSISVPASGVAFLCLSASPTGCIF